MKKNSVYEQIERYWPGYLIATALVILDGIASYIYPKMITNIVDGAIPNKDMNAVILNIIYMALCQAVSILVAFVLSYVFSKVSNGFIIKIKSCLVDSIFSLPGKEIDSKSNLFMTGMINDINNIEMLSSRMFADLLLQIVTVLVTIVILIKINPIILGFMIIVYPILVILQMLFNRSIIAQSKIVMSNMDKSNGLVKELVTYVYEYMVLNGKKYFFNKFFTREQVLRDALLKQNMLIASNRCVPQAISLVTFLLILGISSKMVISGEIMLGELTIIIMYTQRMFNPIASIMLVIGQFQKTKVSVDRVNQIIG